MAAKKKKRKKLDSIPKINRRLFKLWSLAVRDRVENRCEFCGAIKGDIGPNGNPINKIDAHHLLPRDIKDCPLKFDIMNGVAVCPFCHKFGMPSFHRDPITTVAWLQAQRPERHTYVLNNIDVRVDLNNRNVLEEIERCLVAQIGLDLNKLKAIEAECPRAAREKLVIEEDLFAVSNVASEVIEG